MKVYLISDKRDTLVGMRLAGIKGTLVHDVEEAKVVLEQIVKNNDIGIVLITEKLALSLKDRINYIKIKMPSPLIVEIPDRHGSIKGNDYITGYVKDSIGIKV